jgi:hypothetical protein
MHDDRSKWAPVVDLMNSVIGDKRIPLSGPFGQALTGDPERLLAELALYKFAAKMLGKRSRVLDLDAGDGIGTWVLAVECGAAHGVSADAGAAAWVDERATFGASVPEGEWDGVVALGGSAGAGDVAGLVARHGLAVVRSGDVAGFKERFAHVFAFRAVETHVTPAAHDGDVDLLVCVRPR